MFLLLFIFSARLFQTLIVLTILFYSKNERVWTWRNCVELVRVLFHKCKTTCFTGKPKRYLKMMHSFTKKLDRTCCTLPSGSNNAISRSIGPRPSAGSCYITHTLLRDLLFNRSVENCNFSRSSGCRGRREKVKPLPRHRETYRFEPIAIETIGAIRPSTTRFLSDLGRKILFKTGERRASEWMYQRISVTVMQRL